MRKSMFSMLLLVLTLGVFQSLKDADFLGEDKLSLELAGPSGDSSLLALWQPTAGVTYEPLAPTLWRGFLALIRPQADHRARALHLLSLAFHGANSVLVFLLLCLLLEGEAAAFLGAALFALHPLQVEPVAYIGAFKFVLGGFFALLALWQFLHYAQSVQSGRQLRQSRQRHGGTHSYLLASVAYILALVSHPCFVMVPAAAYLLSKLLPKQKALYHPKVASWRLGLWVVLALPQVCWTLASQRHGGIGNMMPVWSRPLVAGDSLSFYLGKTLLPLAIGPDYGRSPLAILSHWWGYVTWLIPLAVLAVLAGQRSQRGLWYRSTLLLFAAILAPALGLLCFAGQQTSTVAGRYSYLALLAPALALAYTAAKAKRAALPAALVAVVAAFAWLAAKNVSYWLSDEQLWSHALSVNPASPVANRMLGDRAWRAGDWGAAREHYRQVLASNAFSPSVYYNLAEIEREHGDAHLAIEYYTKALQLNPQLQAAYGRLGASYLLLGNEASAMEYFRQAADRGAPDADTLRRLGTLYVLHKDYAAAIPYLTQAIKQSGDTDASEAHALLGKALLMTHEPTLAKTHLEIALERNPNLAEANRELADINFDEGDYRAAGPRYEKVLQHGPSDFAVYQHLGMIYEARKEYTKALSVFSSAQALRPGEPQTLKSLGTAHFHLRQYKEATVYLQKALNAAPNQADAHLYLGDIDRWGGKDAEAMHEYQAAIKCDPNLAEAHYRLGNLYLKNEQTEQAIRQFEAGLKVVPTDPKLNYALRQAEKARDGGKAAF